MSRIIAGHPNPHEPISGQPARLIGPRGVQGELTQQLAVEGHDADIEVSDVGASRGALPSPTDGDVEDLGVVTQGHLAATVQLVGADPERTENGRVDGHAPIRG